MRAGARGSRKELLARESCGAGGRRPEQAGCGEVALHGRDGAGDGGAGGAPGSHRRRESPRPSAPSARAGAGTAWAALCRGLPRCHGLLWCHQLCWCLAPHQHLVPRPGCWLPSVSLTSTSALFFCSFIWNQLQEDTKPNLPLARLALARGCGTAQEGRHAAFRLQPGARTCQRCLRELSWADGHPCLRTGGCGHRPSGLPGVRALPRCLTWGGQGRSQLNT